MNEGSAVSILIPAYKSEKTISKTLTSLRHQTVLPHEVIVVDSSPDESTEQLVRLHYPEILYHHSAERLLPHAARNKAVRLSSGDFIVFTDPDIIAYPNWLENLLTVYRTNPGAICGSVQCYENSWTHVGLHLTKFDKWLPGGPVRRTDIGPTVNLLLARSDFDRAGDLEGRYMIGDTLFSWRLASLGIPITFAPAAVVEHEHTETWIEILHQMYARGREFGYARRTRRNWSLFRLLAMTTVSILPIRLTKILIRVFGNSLRAGIAGSYVLTFPIILTGHIARLAGEVAGYFRQTEY